MRLKIGGHTCVDLLSQRVKKKRRAAPVDGARGLCVLLKVLRSYFAGDLSDKVADHSHVCAADSVPQRCAQKKSGTRHLAPSRGRKTPLSDPSTGGVADKRSP